MKNTVKISVVQNQIDNGQRARASCCPIALAVKYTLNQEHVSVNGCSVTVCRRFLPDKRYLLPEEAVRFITAFDYRGRDSVQPFEFEMSAI